MKQRFALHTMLLLFLMVIDVYAEDLDGTAAIALQGNLPEAGLFAASNSFSQNTTINVTNLENGKTTQVVIAKGLDASDYGFLLTLSRDAAAALGIYGRDIVRVRAALPADSAAFSRYNDGRSFSGDPDYDPRAFVRSNAMPFTGTTPAQPSQSGQGTAYAGTETVQPFHTYSPLPQNSATTMPLSDALSLQSGQNVPPNVVSVPPSPVDPVIIVMPTVPQDISVQGQGSSRAYSYNSSPLSEPQASSRVLSSPARATASGPYQDPGETEIILRSPDLVISAPLPEVDLSQSSTKTPDDTSTETASSSPKMEIEGRSEVSSAPLVFYIKDPDEIQTDLPNPSVHLPEDEPPDSEPDIPTTTLEPSEDEIKSDLMEPDYEEQAQAEEPLVESAAERALSPTDGSEDHPTAYLPFSEPIETDRSIAAHEPDYAVSGGESDAPAVTAVEESDNPTVDTPAADPAEASQPIEVDEPAYINEPYLAENDPDDQTTEDASAFGVGDGEPLQDAAIPLADTTVLAEEPAPSEDAFIDESDYPVDAGAPVVDVTSSLGEPTQPDNTHLNEPGYALSGEGATDNTAADATTLMAEPAPAYDDGLAEPGYSATEADAADGRMPDYDLDDAALLGALDEPSSTGEEFGADSFGELAAIDEEGNDPTQLDEWLTINEPGFQIDHVDAGQAVPEEEYPLSAIEPPEPDYQRFEEASTPDSAVVSETAPADGEWILNEPAYTRHEADAGSQQQEGPPEQDGAVRDEPDYLAVEETTETGPVFGVGGGEEFPWNSAVTQPDNPEYFSGLLPPNERTAFFINEPVVSITESVDKIEERAPPVVITPEIRIENKLPPAALIESTAGLEAGKFYVQIGGYTNAERIEAVMREFADVYPLVLMGKRYILIGPLNEGESNALEQRFRARGFTNAFVVKRTGS
jgi:hypothetical protein